MTLKSLEEYNEIMRRAYKETMEYPRPNGIACPKCGKELMDSDLMILISMPPQKNTHCPECGFKGYRVV